MPIKPLLTIILGPVNAEKDCQAVIFSGELDKLGYDNVKASLDEVVANFAPKTLIFDFTNLAFINSESIGYLIDVQDKLAQKGKSFVVVGAADHVQDVLKVLGVTELIPTFKTIDDYVKS